MKKLILLALIVSSSAFCASEEYNTLKGHIDSLENSLIQNFDVEIPSNKNGIPFEAYQKALGQIEGQYANQLQNFKNVGLELDELRLALTSDFKTGHIKKEERERLINSIDYAKRIILQSRQQEIQRVYFSLKSKLSHIPKLEKLHEQLAEASKEDCPIKNLFFDKLKGILSFDVLTKTETGIQKNKKMNFVLTQGDVSQGSFNSEVRKFGEREEYVTQFQSRFPSSDGIFAFTLKQDKQGQLTHLAFRQMEAKTPWVEFMGVSFGEDKEDRICDCQLSN